MDAACLGSVPWAGLLLTLGVWEGPCHVRQRGEQGRELTAHHQAPASGIQLARPEAVVWEADLWDCLAPGSMSEKAESLAPF